MLDRQCGPIGRLRTKLHFIIYLGRHMPMLLEDKNNIGLMTVYVYQMNVSENLKCNFVRNGIYIM